MYKTRFSIEDQFGPYEGYSAGELWNGWECPFFEFEIAERIAADMDGWHDEQEDRFCIPPDQNNPDEIDSFAATEIEVEGQMLKVYPIGARCWIWSATDENDLPAGEDELIWFVEQHRAQGKLARLIVFRRGAYFWVKEIIPVLGAPPKLQRISVKYAERDLQQARHYLAELDAIEGITKEITK